jgi:hypothetical protein
VEEEELELTEGESYKNLTVTSVLPPRLFCGGVVDPANCAWTISTVFLTPGRDVSCADGRTVYQAVVGSHARDQAPFCGVRLTEENWKQGAVVMVTAVVDGLKDGKQTLSLKVTATLSTTSIVVTTIPVSAFVCLYKIKPLILTIFFF